MGYDFKKGSGTYTYKDYLNWPDEERWEIIEGVAYDMSPAPSRIHQEISGALFTQFSLYLEDKACRVYHAPFDVRLPKKKEKDEDTKTVVQPDIVVICDQSKLDDKGDKGSPDLIAEILSPQTAIKDMNKKFSLYERVKVKEYWIVHPEDKTVMIFKLNTHGEYGKPEIYGKDDEVKVGIFKDLAINLKRVFKS